MSDLLTYLDEVDVRQADAVKFDEQIPISMAIGVKFDLPALSKALRAVLERHAPYPESAMGYEATGPGTGYGTLDGPACSSCGTPDEYAVRYPCPTAQAIQAALAVNDEGGK